MRVLHLYSGNLFGGVERMLLALWGRRAECAAMRTCYALCFQGRLARELRDSGADVTLLGPARASRPWTVSAARGRLRNLMERDTFDVAVTHGLWSHAMFGRVVREARVPIAAWLHDAPGRLGWLERWAARVGPDLLLANSRFTATAASRLYPGTPVEIQPPPMELPVRADRRSAEQRDHVVILLLGRLQPGKGHAVLLDALGHLCDLPGWTCRIAGAPQRPAERRYLVQLRERARELGLASRVRFVGHVEAVATVLAGADIFCHPHTSAEAFGMAIVEAMAAGLPVVTSNLGGPAELIDASCGTLVPPADAAQLANRLRELIADPDLRHRLGEAAEARASRIAAGASVSALCRRLGRLCCPAEVRVA